MIKFLFVICIFLMSCMSNRPDFRNAVKEIEDVVGWSIEPTYTYLDIETILVIKGKDLSSVEIVTDESVDVVKKEIFENGTRAKLFIRVNRLDYYDKRKGYRTITLKAVDFSKQFEIKILDDE